jgi:UDP-glucose 4-epimerase
MYAEFVKTVLITGARGFIGRHLAKRLGGQGIRVLGLGHGGWTEDEHRQFGIAKWGNGDVTRQNLSVLSAGTGGIDSIIHLAGGSSVGPSLSAPEEDFRRTVLSTIELLEWIRTASPATSMVFASSAAVYGTGHAGPICNDAAVRPTSPYGAHKRIAEELCNSHCRSFGLRAAVVRLFSVYGPGLRKQLLWDACARLSRGPAVLELGGTGNERRDFLHVSDAAAFLHAAAADASTECPAFNAGTGVPVSIRQVAEQLVDAWNSSARVRFTDVARTGDPESLVADIGVKPAEASPIEWSWQDGLREYVAWFKRDGRSVA